MHLAPLADMGWFYVSMLIGSAAVLATMPLVILVEAAIINHFLLMGGKSSAPGEGIYLRALKDAFFMNLYSGILGWITFWSLPTTLWWRLGVTDTYTGKAADEPVVFTVMLVTLFLISLVVETIALWAQEYRLPFEDIVLSATLANVVSYMGLGLLVYLRIWV